MKREVKKQLFLFPFIAIILVLFSCSKETFDPRPYLVVAKEQVTRTLEHFGDSICYPGSISPGNEHWECTRIYGWTSGFFPGLLWQLYNYTGEDRWKEVAHRWTLPLEPLSRWGETEHDMGFRIFCSFGKAFQLTGDPYYKEVVLEAAGTLADLYNPNAGTILSWPWAIRKRGWAHNTIIDNMMNLELLFWASKNGGEEAWYDMAVSHAKTTMEHQIREDYSTWHVVVCDSITGEVTGKYTHQGYSENSTWARGQAWGIYGFTMTFRETGDPVFLETARGLADYFLDNLPEDHVPYWDFHAPGIPDEEKDASAAAIAASGMLELSELTGDNKYYDRSVEILKSLSSPEYQAKGVNDAILLHSVGSKPGDSDMDVPIIYADYYYVEALLRLLDPLNTCYAPSRIFIRNKKGKNIYHEGWIDLNKNNERDIYEDPSSELNERIDDLLSRMTLEEKTCQMATWYGYGRVMNDELPTVEWKNKIIRDGIGNMDEHLNGLAYHEQAKTEYSWPPSRHARAINEVQRFFVEETRLGIPVDFTNEGIRGVCHHGATGFPAQIGMGSTWNSQLISGVGKVTGREGRILGYTNIYSPILDLARDPRWGRTVECYGEDPFLVSRLGLSMVQSLQSEGVASTGKHYAVYSAPKGGRDGVVRTDPHVTEREVHRIFLEPFRRAVTEGNIMGLMSSYNDYNGIPVTGSPYFLTELLRENWGFEGYVVSDSWAVGGLQGRHYVAEDYKECVYLSVMAGLNIRTDFTSPEDFILPLRELVKEGRIPMDTIDSRVRDVLRVKFRLRLFDEPYVEEPLMADKTVHHPEHEAIALQASRESIVLLKNENGFLPVDRNSIRSLLVTGPNAGAVNHSISRYGPSHIDVVSVYDGIRELVDDRLDVQFTRGCDFHDENWPRNELYDIPMEDEQQRMIDETVEKAQNVDMVIVAVGDNEMTVGEGKSRTSLNLPGNQEDLVRALYDTGRPVLVVLINGRPLSVNWIDEHIDAVIEGWFPGEFGGTAIAEVIFGEYNPGGKLPITFPRTVGQIPFNFPHKRSSQLGQGDGIAGETRINDALYPFGHGLSYTDFTYSDLTITPDRASADFDSISVSFRLSNAGEVAGDEVAQLYIRDEFSSVVGYEKMLRGFERVPLEPGQEKRVTFTLHREDLALLDKDMVLAVEPGDFTLFVGSSSEDIRLKGVLKILTSQ